MSSRHGRPAYVEDYDETTGTVDRDNRQVASTKKSKGHRDSRKPRISFSDAQYPGEGSSRDAPAVEEKVVRVERRKSTSSASSKSPRKNRPPSAHENKTFHKSSIPTSKRETYDPSSYGIAATAQQPFLSQPMPIRPRAVTQHTYPPPARPVSFHAAMPGGFSRPPLSASAFYQQPQTIPPSYPPTTPTYTQQVQYTTAPQNEYYQPQPQQQLQQASSRPLSQRFDSRYDPIARAPSAFDPITRSGSAFEPIARSGSAFGARSAYEDSGSYFDDSYTSAAEEATIRRERRDSIRVPSHGMTRAQADYAAMPPPPTIRPSIRRRSTEYARAPSEYTLEPEPYRDGRTMYRREESRPRRSSSNRHSVSYEASRGSESVRVEAANSGRRRQSWYEPPEQAPASAYEDKLHKAATYQEDVGGPTVPLTAETLKRQQRRHGGSSRSTKSSQSRDESDYKKSAATSRTTRSMSNDNDENVTIKVTGQARVMVGGAQIHCDEGGEIEIKRQQKNLQNDSEPSNSEYGEGRRLDDRGGGRRLEDRRSRVERPSVKHASRSSQSGHSYTRSTPHYPGENFT
ncbi:hypothetical protein NA56DRAFT_706918 [Hyaloscypha hepaticicola]|uniref:Uncharacterized protein n=1 Tax=Hyaloscypha hepaticicola TaxID=2082293 RepID=A0A2J6PW92_9HELO|nr:hypothetical protein NA56DRAFT_706918 [Hyaloscypha hepaticicola]